MSIRCKIFLVWTGHYSPSPNGPFTPKILYIGWISDGHRTEWVSIQYFVAFTHIGCRKDGKITSIHWKNWGTKPILSDVHPMTIRCVLVWTAHNIQTSPLDTRDRNQTSPACYLTCIWVKTNKQIWLQLTVAQESWENTQRWNSRAAITFSCHNDKSGKKRKYSLKFLLPFNYRLFSQCFGALK